jgi:hypothetical protein
MNDRDFETSSYEFKKEYTFSRKEGIIFSFVFSLVWFLLNWLLNYFIYKSNSIIDVALGALFNLLYFLLIFFGGIIFQEIIKSLILRYYAGVNWAQQNIGFSATSLLPYVESKYPVSIKAYRLLLIIPSLVICQLIWLSYIYRHYEFILFTSLWLFFTGYDILSFFKIIKIKGNFLVASHPDKPGLIIYEDAFSE